MTRSTFGLGLASFFDFAADLAACPERASIQSAISVVPLPSEGLRVARCKQRFRGIYGDLIVVVEQVFCVVKGEATHSGDPCDGIGAPRAGLLFLSDVVG